MKFTILTFAILSLFAVGAVLAQQNNDRKTNRTKQTKMQAGDKIVYEADAEMLRNLQGKVRVVESKQDWTEFNRQSPSVNPARTRTAYTAKFPIEADAENLMDVVVVHDAGDDKFYEIRGIEDFPWRPLSDLKWISNDVLQFEQWVNPNNGGRYRVNLKTGKLVAAGYVRSR